MAKERPYFRFYPHDWLTSTSVLLMDHEQRGAYIHLLALCWTMEECAIVASAKQLLRLCHWSASEERFKPVADMFTPHPTKEGCVTNKRIYQEYVEYVEYCKQQANKGKSGGLAKARQRLSNGLAEGVAESSQSHSYLKTSSSGSSQKKILQKNTASDDSWFAELKQNPAYSHIDMAVARGKMQAWLDLPRNKHRKMTRSFVLNWLNKIEPPLTVLPTVKPVRKLVL